MVYVNWSHSIQINKEKDEVRVYLKNQQRVSKIIKAKPGSFFENFWWNNDGSGGMVASCKTVSLDTDTLSYLVAANGLELRPKKVDKTKQHFEMECCHNMVPTEPPLTSEKTGKRYLISQWYSKFKMNMATKPSNSKITQYTDEPSHHTSQYSQYNYLKRSGQNYHHSLTQSPQPVFANGTTDPYDKWNEPQQPSLETHFATHITASSTNILKLLKNVS